MTPLSRMAPEIDLNMKLMRGEPIDPNTVSGAAYQNSRPTPAGVFGPNGLQGMPNYSVRSLVCPQYSGLVPAEPYTKVDWINYRCARWW